MLFCVSTNHKCVYSESKTLSGKQGHDLQRFAEATVPHFISTHQFAFEYSASGHAVSRLGKEFLLSRNPVQILLGRLKTVSQSRLCNHSNNGPNLHPNRPDWNTSSYLRGFLVRHLNHIGWPGHSSLVSSANPPPPYALTTWPKPPGGDKSFALWIGSTTYSTPTQLSQKKRGIIHTQPKWATHLGLAASGDPAHDKQRKEKLSMGASYVYQSRQ